MRKAIIAAIVATALFAVGAFAAEFAVTAEDVASGSDAVDRCASAAAVDFTESYNTTTKDFEVSAVKVTFTAEAPLSCATREATLLLQDADGSSRLNVYEGKKIIGADNTVTFIPACTASSDPEATVACPPSWTYLPVKDVWNASVLVDDAPVATTAP